MNSLPPYPNNRIGHYCRTNVRAHGRNEGCASNQDTGEGRRGVEGRLVVVLEDQKGINPARTLYIEVLSQIEEHSKQF